MTTRRQKAITKEDQKLLSPQHVARMRASVFKRVQNQIDEAHAVVMGQKDWTPTQARVFATMLNKVMPDLTAQFVQHEHATKSDMRELSREDLERIALGLDDDDNENEHEEKDVTDVINEATSGETPTQTP